jgi:2-dehydro-3-deoxy-D-arabinonate dehydratase
MLLGRYQPPGSEAVLCAFQEERVVNLTAADPRVFGSLAVWLQQPDPVQSALGAWRLALGEGEDVRLSQPDAWRLAPGAALAAPIDRQEVWAAGVTYLRSKEARMEESEGGGSFYDRVYAAERPELFLKATPSRVVGPNEAIRIRRDAAWSVPEPEVALVISAGGRSEATQGAAHSLRIVGYTVGNDVSSRDIEGENPLYLPQAKVYRQCCALGPVILLEEERRGHRNFDVRLTIERRGELIFRGETSTSQMKRRFDELVAYLGRDNLFPDGAFLLTGTGIVPPDDFSLQAGDVVAIDVPEIGTLSNPVVQGGEA